jgi:hypothetical protein
MRRRARNLLVFVFARALHTGTGCAQGACKAKCVTSSVRAGVGLHVRRTERRLMCWTAVCALVCARKDGQIVKFSSLFMDTNRRASPKVDRHNLHFGAAHHDTDYGTSCAALDAFLLGRAGKLSSIRSSVPLF